jgi:hypothetical protein
MQLTQCCVPVDASEPAVLVDHLARYHDEVDGVHLKGGIERVETEIDVPGHQPGNEPQLQRHVGRAVLHRGQPDMMVTVDEPRQYHLPPGADHWEIGMPFRELGEGASRR